MTIGMGMLRLPPETFWRMTLPELSAAASVFATGENGMTRHALDALRERFPDTSSD